MAQQESPTYASDGFFAGQGESPFLALDISLDGNKPISQHAVATDHKPQEAGTFTVFSMKRPYVARGLRRLMQDDISDAFLEVSELFPSQGDLSPDLLYEALHESVLLLQGITQKDITADGNGNVIRYDMILHPIFDVKGAELLKQWARNAAQKQDVEPAAMIHRVVPECRISSREGIDVFIEDRFVMNFSHGGLRPGLWLENEITQKNARVIEPNLTVPPFRAAFEIGNWYDRKKRFGRPMELSMIGGIEFAYPTFSDIDEEIKRALAERPDDVTAIYAIVKPFFGVEFPDPQQV